MSVRNSTAGDPVSSCAATELMRHPIRLPCDIGSWRLNQFLGGGAFSNVYRAAPVGQEGQTAGDYAVKIANPADPQSMMLARQLIQREAFVGESVSHPHVVSVFLSEIDELPNYLVTPYLEGQTLRQLSRHADLLCLPQKLWLIRQVAQGLNCLHDSGWVHGDVKPENIMVSSLMHVTLLDLGFASRIGDSNSSADQPFMATPTYAAPECFRPKERRTGRSDIYSLGVVLYELLTGRTPFLSNDPQELVAAHLDSPATDVRKLVPDLPRRVGRLVGKLLAKEPLRRPSGEELVDWLMDLEIETFQERSVPLAA